MKNKYQGTRESEIALDTFIKINRCANSLQARVAQCVAKHDLTLSQFAVLEALMFNGELRAGDISKKILKSGGNITKVVENLEKGNLVLKTKSKDDARCHLIQLTEFGKSKIQSVFPEVAALITEMMYNLNANQVSELGVLSKKLGYAVQQNQSAKSIS